MNWDKPPKNIDEAWHTKIRLIDPDGEEFTKTLQSIPTTRKLFKREILREIIDLDHFYDTEGTVDFPFGARGGVDRSDVNPRRIEEILDQKREERRDCRSLEFEFENRGEFKRARREKERRGISQTLVREHL
ncbi:hypothetical protein Tco_1092869 [Tanacetum coccineum]|uniref:Uncharacterized protein n=1 Tax=Tanacetum coccineum TaxID=301880 RepID=A0ABQ5IB37_9ASTR